MERIAVFTSNALYFREVRAAIKSFLRFNSNWNVYLLDIGLTAEQKVELTPYVHEFVDSRLPTDNGRFLDSTAMMDFLISVEDRDALIYHLDADTLTFGSIEPWVESFLLSSGHVSAIATTKAASTWVHIPDDDIKAVFPNFPWDHKLAMNGGSMLGHAKPLGEIERHRKALDPEHRMYISGATDILWSMFVFEHGYSARYCDLIYGATTEFIDALLTPPLTEDGNQIVVAHLVGMPSFLMDPARKHGKRIGPWYRRWLRHYEETA
jgi:hypothetical protein